MKLLDKYGYDLNKIIDYQESVGAHDVVNVCTKAQEIEFELIDAQNKGIDISDTYKLFWLRRFWTRLLEYATASDDDDRDGFIREEEMDNLDAKYLDGKHTPKIPIGE